MKGGYPESCIVDKEKETVIHHCQVNFQSIKKYASDLQIFLQ